MRWRVKNGYPPHSSRIGTAFNFHLIEHQGVSYSWTTRHMHPYIRPDQFKSLIDLPRDNRGVLL